jgi:hypothetical protein
LKCESGDGSQGGVVQATFEAEAGKPTPLQPGFQSLEAAQVVARGGPEVVLEAGHCPHDEVPGPVNAALLEWLAGLGGSAVLELPSGPGEQSLPAES